MLYLTIPATQTSGDSDIKTEHTGMVARPAEFLIEDGLRLSYRYKDEADRKHTEIAKSSALQGGLMMHVCFDPDDPNPQAIGVAGDDAIPDKPAG
ncbi:MAG: hypothetical protein WKF75_15565 [Singulisphaera sp.]